MSKDIVPSQPSGLSGFIEKLNLPSMVAGPAGTAIARLVGAAVDVPVAYLENFARAIRARTEAKDAVNKEIATAAAHFAAGDSDLVARAAYVIVAKEFRRQKNKEEIAVRTIELPKVVPKRRTNRPRTRLEPSPYPTLTPTGSMFSSDTQRTHQPSGCNQRGREFQRAKFASPNPSRSRRFALCQNLILIRRTHLRNMPI